MAEIRDIWIHAHRIIRSARKIINTSLRPLGLGSAEGNILLHVLLQGGAVGQEELVEQLDISKPAVSRAVESLERKGLVARTPDPDDRRALRVRLTGKAREIGPAVEQAYNRVYTVALRDIDSRDLTGFVKQFRRISENFERELEKE